MTPAELDRFEAKMAYEPTSGCWLWLGGLAGDARQYPSFRTTGGFRGHRTAYEHWKGKIPNGLELDHLCRTPQCVNPDHLEPVTHLENMRRGTNAQKTHCIRGHELCEANVYRYRGRRCCRSCTRNSPRRIETEAAPVMSVWDSYDAWKLRNPYDREEELATCVECGAEFDAEYANDADEDGAYRYLVSEVCGACQEIEHLRAQRANVAMQLSCDRYSDEHRWLRAELDDIDAELARREARS